MHLHQHIKNCILDYGPIASFWVFSFERYNGFLGKYPTNNRSVEVQIMRWFQKDLHYRSLELPTRINEEPIILPAFDFIHESVQGTLMEMTVVHSKLSFELFLASHISSPAKQQAME